MVGLVLSTFTKTSAVAVLPDVSIAVPLTSQTPSPTVWVAVQDRTATMSWQSKLTATFELFHPFALAAGAAVPVIDGAVVSRTATWNVAAAGLPAASRAVQITKVVPRSDRVPPAWVTGRVGLAG